MSEIDVRVCEKYALTVTEAAAYFGIGEKKLRSMIEDYSHLGLFIQNGVKYMATSKNSFLMIWARDFGSAKVSESSEYFVYCGLFETNCWSKRSGQIAKGGFLEVPI